MRSASSFDRSGVYRSVSTLRGAILATVILAGLVAVALVPGSAQIVGYIFGPLWLIVTCRAWMTGVRVEAEGVKVIGFLISRWVPWEDIDHFAVMPAGRYPYVGFIVRCDKRPPIPLVGLSAAGRPKARSERFRRQVEGPINDLNRILADVRAN